MRSISKNHPRYNSLMVREKITKAMKKDLVHKTGLIAHGRGEAFDYLIGEKTIPCAEDAERIAAAALIMAKNPVISVNGNVVALVAKNCIRISNIIPAKIEVNLFHRTNKRMNSLISELKRNGADYVYGMAANARIPGLNHNRGLCEKDGIFSSDVILIPLEDGDRCQALRSMGKFVIAIDLNPLSRTAKTANVTIVDNVIRAIPNIEKWIIKFRELGINNLKDMVDLWDNKKMLKEVYVFISKRLNSMFL